MAWILVVFLLVSCFWGGGLGCLGFGFGVVIGSAV